MPMPFLFLPLCAVTVSGKINKAQHQFSPKILVSFTIIFQAPAGTLNYRIQHHPGGQLPNECLRTHYIPFHICPLKYFVSKYCLDLDIQRN